MLENGKSEGSAVLSLEQAASESRVQETAGEKLTGGQIVLS